jgi:PKD domain-containing protein
MKRRTPAFLGLLFLAVFLLQCDENDNDLPGAPSGSPAPPPLAEPNPVPTIPPPSGGPTGNQPPVPDFRVTPSSATGPAPLVVNFNLCPTADPDHDPILFFFDFGDGTTAQGPPCRQQNTYHQGRYTANMCVWDSRPEHALQCVAFAVDAK